MVSLGAEERALLATARRAVLATRAPSGRPRVVPIVYGLVEREARLALYTPIDEKPKRSRETRALARVRDVLRDPRVAVLVDRWSEDWSRLAWLRLDGSATLVAAEDADADRPAALASLRERYPQYASQDLRAAPLIRIAVERAVSWSGGAGPGATPSSAP